MEQSLEVSKATKLCRLLLASVAEDVELKSELAKQFELKKIHLLTTAEVINNVLHKNNSNSTRRKREYDSPNDLQDDFFILENQIEEESKTTRRNAHYKSTVLVMFYYIIHLAYYEKVPKYIGYNHIIQSENTKARQYLEARPLLMEKLFTTKKLEKCQNIPKYKINKIPVPTKVKNDEASDIEYKPIQHYNTFKQYTYDYNRACVIDGVMMDFIKFGYENFNKNCRSFIIINLVIKHKEKEKYDQEKKNKKRPLRFVEDTYDEDLAADSNSDIADELTVDFNADTTDVLQKSNLMSSELVEKYKDMAIEELKNELKEPSVLMKFYQAFLFECDWEMLFKYLISLLTDGFCYASMLKLLIYLVWNVTKVVCTAKERDCQTRNLDLLLKQYKYMEVLLQLQQWTYEHKYSIYELPHQDLDINTKTFDIKQFNEYARNTRHMYSHFTANPVTLFIGEKEFPKIQTNIKYIYYILDNHNQVMFDLIRVTKTDNNTKVDLSQTSWQDRLDKLSDLLKQVNRVDAIIKITPTNKRIIQYGKLPCSTIMFHWIRTSGLGLGTLFYSTNYKKIRCTNMPNKRFRRLSIKDLEYQTLECVDIVHPEESQNIQQRNSNVQNYQDIISPVLTNILNELFLGRGNFNNLSSSSSQNSSGSGNLGIKDSPPAAVSSSDYDISTEYLGNLKILSSDLEFAQYNEDDDI
ncbi:hypothetical protein HgNV_030 [Homarus gammarus nudivirus]|uniref:Uncharacterized protein n=1 Tax=Homarus gammarus nudivirus TaxID=2509616 RepID=A0A411HB48_9VIRU|nr:hypothetical protein KM727_gp30 [Homarus gammarus nudivirus]QBB28635.1 hypothetical protein HgNV_030 [Homarus gammarus nudivirus]